jgi:hypothetical protein
MPTFIASRGFHELCRHKIVNPQSESRELPASYPTKAGESIYIHTTALDRFSVEMLPLIEVPFVLVSGDTDMIVPIDCQNATERLLASPKLINWYAQNCVKTDHPKLKQLPIGMDFHTLARSGHAWGPRQSIEQQESTVKNMKTWDIEKKSICYANFHFLMTTRFAYDRRDAISRIPRKLVMYEPKPLPRLQSWINMIQCKYVISPHGNGLDCHRTWEAIILGCIPIVKTSPLDSMYKGLPVLIVNDWSDITQELLDSFVPDNSALDILTLDYWNKLINGSLVNNHELHK